MGNVFAGKILRVDLGLGKTETEPLDPTIARAFLGGRGVSAWLLWKECRKGIDPLGPGNPLIFGAGALNGTHAPSSGRCFVTFKSPATNRYCKSSAGGHWGYTLKFGGYDHIVVTGKADRPVYIVIDNDKVEIRDAAHLWGKNTRETDETIKNQLGSDFEVACIGPAGEKLAKIAAVMMGIHFAAARGGPGAVMGSKKLKAVAVRGSGALGCAKPEEFDRVAMAARAALRNDSMIPGLADYGTAGGVAGVNEQDGFPSYNYQRGHFDPIEPLTGQSIVHRGYLLSRMGCGACTISCHRHTSLGPNSPWAGTHTGGPEYETLGAFGAGPGVADVEAVIKCGEICNLYGLDTISAGSVCQFAIESFERGVLTEKDTGGLVLRWGDGQAMVKLLEKIARREGIGDLLAEGTKIASERLGNDSHKWAVQARGLEQSRVETRTAKGYALAFAVNPRGPDHLMTETMAEFGTTPEARALIKEITGDEKLAVPYLTEGRPEIVRWHEDCYAATDALGLCVFTTTLAYAVTPTTLAELFSSATGLTLSTEEVMEAGRRIVTIERAFNAREGYGRESDTLPWRIMNEPLEVGPDKRKYVNSPAELGEMLDKYYALHGWDIETGKPTRKALDKLGLGGVADELGL